MHCPGLYSKEGDRKTDGTNLNPRYIEFVREIREGSNDLNKGNL